MAITSSILGQYEANLNAQAGTDRVAADKNTFLKLLVAQLTHQDPLNPTEDKEFIAQLAQFTSVEELQNLNKGMESLNASYLRQQTTNAVNMIGMRVTAKGDVVNIRNVDGSNPDLEPTSSIIMMNLPADAAQVVANVYSTQGDDTIGTLVYSANIGAWSQGTHRWQWTGTDGAGNPMPDGNYIVNFAAVDANGQELLVNTQSMGTVVLVETQADGNHKLMLEDGRIIYFNNIEYVTDPNLAAGSEGEDGDDGKDGEDGKEEAGTEGGSGGDTGGGSDNGESAGTDTARAA